MLCTLQKSLFICSLMLLSGLTGCLGFGADSSNPNTIRIAFEIKDDYTSADMNPQILADFLSQQTGLEVELYPITSEGAIIEALRFGHADIAFMDAGAAWMGWQQYGLEVLAADTKSDDRTYYNAHAVVLNGSDAANAYLDDNASTDPFATLEGTTSCHTGWLKSAGMLLPMGFLISEGYAPIVGPEDDIESLRSTIYSYFSEDASIPDRVHPIHLTVALFTACRMELVMSLSSRIHPLQPIADPTILLLTRIGVLLWMNTSSCRPMGKLLRIRLCSILISSMRTNNNLSLTLSLHSTMRPISKMVSLATPL